MKPATLVSLLVSLALGAGAVFLGRGYMQAQGNEAAATTAAAPVLRKVDVLVVAQPIATGDKIEPDMLKVSKWAEGTVPEGALKSVNEITETVYALGVMVPGEAVVAAKLDMTGASLSMAAQVAPGLRAVAVVVEDDTGVAGWVLPGDHVDVHEFVPKDETGGQRLDPDAARQSADLIARPVVRNVRVLAVDQTFDPNLSGAVPSNTVTLEVTPEDALAVSVASQRNALGLTLIGEKQAGETPVVETPIKKQGRINRPAARVTPVRADTRVRVINGGKAEDITAPVAAQTGGDR